jgi:hypothetical protein
MSIVPSCGANIRVKTEGQRRICAFIDDKQGQTETLAAQPATKGHGVIRRNLARQSCRQTSNRR